MTTKIDTPQKAFQALGNMALFYKKMISRDSQNLIGMFDILNSDDPCICFFLDSDHQEVQMTQGAPKNVMNVRYQLNKELFEEEVCFRTIEMFRNTVKENIQNEVLEGLSYKN